MSKILVTTDFSANSKAGLRFAAQLALKTGTELVFYNDIEMLRPTSWSDKKYNAYVKVLVEESQTKLRKFVKTTLRNESLPVAQCSYISELGGHNVAQEVLRYARKSEITLICMSTRGAGKIKRLFGTVASGLITYSEIPLLVVPHDHKTEPINKIFYASDFSALKKELHQVLKFAAALDAKIAVYHYDYLLHVRENRTRLNNLIKKQKVTGVSFHLRQQNIQHSISRHLESDIRKENASIVVLFTKQNLNWFDRLFARQESANMAFNALVPLLIFRKDNSKQRKKQ